MFTSRSYIVQHVEKSLTVQNIAYEVFSPFSAAFADVRKVCELLGMDLLLISSQVQVEFFLEHWSDIRASDAMSNVWLEIRSGRHPGFEEGSDTSARVALLFFLTSW